VLPEDLKFNTERAGVTLTPVKQSVEDYFGGITEATDLF